jgi:FkbM family methyltransferase
MRTLPGRRIKRPVISLAARWSPPPVPFAFTSRQTGVRWSSRGLPDLLTRHMLFEGSYQQDVLVGIEGVLKPGDTFLDCGGHHGLMAIIASRAVGPRGRVITFEPNPWCRQMLQENCALNDVTNLTLDARALGEAVGTITFYVQSGLVSWNSSIFPDFASQQGRDAIEPIEVERTTLDAYLGNGLRPAMIKIDAEGSEFLILNGATETLRRHRPVLSMEFNPESASAARTTIREVRVFLEHLGYRLVVLERDAWGRYAFDRQTPFDERRHGSEFLANVLCLPPDHADRIVG